MIISIHGLGYVGSVSAACFAQNGHHVIGVDVNFAKVDLVNSGQSPIIEEGLSELLRAGVDSGRIRATADASRAVQDSDISMICVGTPGNADESPNLSYVRRACTDVGQALADKHGYHLIVVRSTMLPGSIQEVVIPLLERFSGKKAGDDWGVCYNPEFMREGSSVRDFYNPPFTVIGSDGDERAIAIATHLYALLDAPLFVVPFKAAEMLKYVNNAFHALKVAFANEIGNICKQQNIDSHQIMDIFCQDTKLNLSPHYLKPGFAFGGSCLPKDLRAMLYHCRRLAVEPILLKSILPSNRRQIKVAYQMVKQNGCKRVGLLGLSFKAGTDDLRESPLVALAEYLLDQGYQIQIYDNNVSLANLTGVNREYIEREIPHIGSLIVNSLERVLNDSEVIIVGNRSPEFETILDKLRPNQTLIDLVRIVKEKESLGKNYQGICW